MTSLTGGRVTGRDTLEYNVTETEIGWMLVMRDGPVTLTQLFDSPFEAVASANYVALLVAPVPPRVH